MKRIFLAFLSGNTRLPPPGEILIVGMPPSPTLVPNPGRAVETHVPVPAMVLIVTVAARTSFEGGTDGLFGNSW
jgi:hypothetical protein